MRQFDFYNEWHLGDCIFNINYINRLVRINDLERVNYYLKEDYIPQVKEFVLYPDRIFLHPLGDRPVSAVNLWIGHNRFVHDHPDGKIYDLMYVDFWKYISLKMGVDNPIKTREENLILLDERASPGEEYDVLFINSKPMSFQVIYEEHLYERIIAHIAGRSLSVCTTYPLAGARHCTITNNYSVRDIAEISTKCRYVIGIHTGPLIPTLNERTLNNVLNYIILDSSNHFSYEKYLKCYSNQEFLRTVRKVIS